MEVQCDRDAFVQKKRMAFSDDRFPVEIADCRIALTSHTAIAKLHVRGATCDVSAVFQLVTDANGILHLSSTSIRKVERKTHRP